MADVERQSALERTTARWRGLASLNPNTQTPNVNEINSSPKHLDKRPVIQQRESDLASDSDVDISLIQTRTYLLSAGIGDTNKQYNKYKGKIGLVLWCFNIVIHFSLDFYEAYTVFGTSWATCIGLFLVTLIVCCVSMIRHSIPWFLRGVKKLKKDGHYPKTLSRVRLLVRFMPLGTIMFAIGAAAGQFGCYAADNALRLNFNNDNNGTLVVVPKPVETFINVLRATSLIHIFYGFASLLLFHMTLVFMIQSSMNEYNERMGKLFRELPITICFSDAVNLFSARAKFVRDGSKKSSIVLTTLLVACCTSFVLNAYNFLFLEKHAIYIWFALAPLIWAVVPLMGAAWITKTYWQYKLVVVNAWVDIPEEHELEAEAHSAMHQSLGVGERPKTPVKRMWGSLVGKVGKKESDGVPSQISKETSEEVKLVSYDKIENGSTERRKSENVDDKDTTILNGKETSSGNSPTRRNSEILISVSSKSNNKPNRFKRLSSSVKLPNRLTPTIMFSDYDGENGDAPPQKKFRLKPISRKISDSSLPDIPISEKVSTPPREVSVQLHDSHSNLDENQDLQELENAEKPREFRVDIEPPEKSPELRVQQTTVVEEKEKMSSASTTGSSTSIALTDEEGPTRYTEEAYPSGTQEGANIDEDHQVLNAEINNSSSMSNLQVPVSSEMDQSEKQSKPNMLSGISKTFHKWRTKTKKKKKFNYEKYIIYLESLLPTVGFSIGGVVIDWNGIYTFIVIMTFLVGVFAQEAFFGN